jgi:hypothetical protein
VKKEKLQNKMANQRVIQRQPRVEESEAPNAKRKSIGGPRGL